MLLYRPLIAAYRQTSVASARRFLLREFADPQLHAEPDELLRELERNKEVGLVEEPGRLSAEINLRERLLKLRLTTRDPARQQGGMWTMHSANKSLGKWVAGDVPASKIAAAAGQWVGQSGEGLTRVLPGEDLARVFASLGAMGPAVALGTLRDELKSGHVPAAAAVGLSYLPGDEGHAALLPAVQARGLPQCTPWLGVALSRMPSATTVGLINRMAKHESRDLREQAAWAVGSFAEHQPEGLIDLFAGEKDPFVRLHLLGSIGRLGVPGGLGTLRKFSNVADPTLLRTAAMKAASRSKDAAAKTFLEEGLRAKDPEVIAEALQGLVGLGVPGDPYLALTRKASEQQHGRLMLVGLLALSIWAPDEAFAKIRELFAQPPSQHWFLAAYVTRYLKTDQTVSLLTKLCSAAHGSDLEEIAVSSLCRYLDEPAAVKALLDVARAGPPPIVMHRMMLDIARHLPPQRAADVADEIRGLLKPGLDPQMTGSLLVALGSLGGSEELPTLYQHLDGPASVAAIHGIELVNDQESGAKLDEIAKGKTSPTSEAAVVALFRLGLKSSAEHFDRLASAADDAPSAGRIFTEMCLSVRCIRETSRLSRLYDALSETAKALPAEESTPKAAKPAAVEGDADIAGEVARAGQKPAQAAPPADFEKVLQQKRKTVRGLTPLAINQGQANASASAVYKDLGKHLKDIPLEETGPSTNVKVIGGLTAVLLLVSSIAGYKIYKEKSQGVHQIEAQRLANLPKLYKPGGDPEANEVKEADTIQGTREKPMRIVTRIAENQIATTGKVKIEKVHFPTALPLRCELEAQLLEGAVEVWFPRGTAHIVMEGARTIVEINGARVRIDLLGSTFQLVVIDGTAVTWRKAPGAAPVRIKTIEKGQGGEFLDGNPMGRLEDVPSPTLLLSAPPSASPAPSPAP